MLDKDIFITTLFQLWFLQFIFVLIDVFTNINLSYYGSIIWYSVIINLVVVGIVLFNRLSKLIKVIFFILFIISLLGYILEFLLNHQIFANSWFWLINACFSLIYLLVNKYRKQIIKVYSRVVTKDKINWGNQAVSLLIILFFLQFIILNLWFSVVINFICIYLLVAKYFTKFNFLKKYYESVRSNCWQKNLNNLFQIVLVIYLVALVVNEFYTLESKVLNVLLFLTIVLGVFSVVFEDKEVIVVSETNKFDYIFGIVLGLIGGVLIYIKTSDLGWLSYIISIISTILIILVSFLILEEDGEEETKSISNV